MPDSELPSQACPVCGPGFAPFLQGRPPLWQVWQALPRRRLPKGAELPGGSLWFVEQGLLRSYWLDAQGQERNRGFHAELDWAGSLHDGAGAGTGAGAGELGLQALEPSELVELPRAQLAQWQQQDDVALALARALGFHIEQLARREASLLLESATQRYQRLLAERPELLARVPQHQLASYLAITPVALSRIRRRLRAAVPHSAPP